MRCTLFLDCPGQTLNSFCWRRLPRSSAWSACASLLTAAISGWGRFGFDPRNRSRVAVRVSKRGFRFPRFNKVVDAIDLLCDKTTHQAILCCRSLLIRVAREDHAIRSHTPVNPSHTGVDVTGFLLPIPSPASTQPRRLGYSCYACK